MEKVKGLLKSISDTSEVLEDGLEDGHLTLLEDFKIAKKAVGIIVSVKDIGAIKEEIKNAKPSDWEETYEWFREEFDLDNDTVETYIEEVLGVIMQFAGMIDNFPKHGLRRN